MVLALLAVLAQLWMVQASTRHWAEMATQALWRADICTAHEQGGTGQGSQGGDQPMGGMQHCPICSVAGASFFASHDAGAMLAPQAHGTVPIHHDDRPAPAATRLRPPAQGPPQAWA